MTLDEIINKFIEAKEHCVPGNTQVHIWSSPTSLNGKNKLEGNVYWIDYDNLGINLYFNKR